MPPNFVHTAFVCVLFAFLFQLHEVSTMECGMVNFVLPTILGGSETIRGEWPFIVAIQKRSHYICGGTIISNRHILTVAHCIQKKNSDAELSPNEMVVLLGAYNLTNKNEEGAIQRNVSEIYIHPDWKAFDKRFDADIAILVLSENITFNDAIQPVCMPTNGITEDMEGSVVGYVVQNYAEIPKRIIVKTVNSSHCFREDGAIAAYASNRTFCGGNGDGSPDRGDSGSGYFFTTGFSWAQYGILTTVRTNRTGHVLPHTYHIYTNLTMFKDWIIEIVNRTGGVVGEARISITMNCYYGYAIPHELIESVYSCKLYNIDIQGNNFEAGSFVGSHSNGKAQQDVEEIRFVNGTMSYLPSGFGLFFENIKHLTVGGPVSDSVSLGTKIVRRSDLRNLTNLRTLTFLRNDIEALHGNALWDLPNLQRFYFIQNKLKYLSEETFSKNRELTSVYFNSNQLSVLPANLFRNNLRLTGVDFQNNFVKTIDENIFKTNRGLNSVSFTSNQLETLPKRLFQHNLVLNLVDFQKNSLSSIDEDLFETNKKLLGAYFSSNRIEYLPRMLFRNNLRLHSVDFANNSITTIDDLFMNNGRLYTVSFAYNRLERLTRNVFRSVSLLDTLNLFSNRLKHIDIDFSKLEQVDSIDLGLNDCIDASYIKQDFGIVVDLVEFQNLVMSSCSNEL